MRIAKAAIKREPVRETELVFCKCAEKRAVRLARLGRGRSRTVRIDDAEEGIVLLREAVKTEARVVTSARDAEACETAFLGRVLVIGGDASAFNPCAVS